MSNSVYNISKEYTRFPGPRFKDDGPNSGEDFRERILVPRLTSVQKQGDRFIVILDGARGYTASFLEEAFGGLVRKGFFTKDQLRDLLEIQANETRVSYWRERVREYIDAAKGPSK